MIHIDNQTTPREKRVGPNVLVLSPTRELAIQIEQEVKKINYKGIRSVCVYGGGDRKGQSDICTKGVEIVSLIFISYCSAFKDNKKNIMRIMIVLIELN